MTRAVFVALVAVVAVLLRPPLAAAQEAHELAARRATIERDQQSASFALQLRQSQEGMDYGAALWQRLRQENLHGHQLAHASQPAARDIAERDRRAQDLAFRGERSWGPVLTPQPQPGNGVPASRWSPTLEPAPRAWTPTLGGNATR
jgi:hypothetical protein